MTSRSRRKRWWIVLGSFAAIVTIAWIAVPLIVAPILRGKLQALVATHMNGRLEVGHLSYRFPYTVHLRDARITTGAGNDRHDIFHIARATLTLDELPLGRGPLLIRNLSFERPALHLVRHSSGEMAGEKFFAPSTQPDGQSPRQKLSDLFRLRHLTLRDGKILFEDRLRGGSAPMVWDRLDTDLVIEPRSAAEYSFRFSAQSPPLATIATQGTIHIDQLLLAIDQFQLKGQVDSTAPTSPIPPMVQGFVEKYGISGELVFDAAGRIPLRDVRSASLHGKIRASDVALRATGFEQPFKSVTGKIQIEAGQLYVERFVAEYGDDLWTLVTARLPLGRDGRIELLDLAGEVRFIPPSPRYAGRIGDVIASLKPGGTLDVRGKFSHDRSADPMRQWEFVVRSRDGSMKPTKYNIPLESIRGEALITRQHIELRNVTASVFGGSMAAAASVYPREGGGFNGRITLENADLNQAVRSFRADPAKELKLSGRGSGTVSFSAQRGSLEALTGEGEMSIRDGDLWEVPVLKGVISEIKVAREALTATQGAAVFNIADRQIHLHRAAVYSPAVGLQGWGKVGFDGALDLSIVAAPLGDWEKHLKQTKIPIISDVAGTVAGAMQKTLDAATGKLLYEFRVTGTHSHPQIRTVPTPILTHAAALVFEKMLRKEQDLMEALRDKRPGD